MRTFLEVIEQRKTNKVAHECFSLMVERGINPVKYVLWLQETNGLSNPNIIRESQEWLTLELEEINESQIAHDLGWAAGSLPRWGLGALKKGLGWAADQASSFLQGGGQGLGQGVDQAFSRGGIQGSPMSPTGFYDTETGHYVKWAGEGEPDPSKKDQWKTVDHAGNEIPPNSPPPQQQQPGQQGGQGGQQSQNGPPPQPQTGGSPEQMVQAAIQSLQDLSKRANRHGSKLQQANIQQMLFNLIQTLQDPNSMAQQQPAGTVPPVRQPQPQPQPQLQPQPQPQPQTTTPPQQQTSWTDHGFGGVLRKKLYEVRIKNLADNLVSAKIDPELFVDWYINEGMNSSRFDEDFRQWAHGLWGGVKGMFNGKGFTGGWNEVDDDYDREAAENTLKAILPLMGKNPQLDQQLQGVNKALRDFLWNQQNAQGGQQNQNGQGAQDGQGGQQNQNGPVTGAQAGDQGNGPVTGGDTSQQDTQNAVQAANDAGANTQDPQEMVDAIVQDLLKPKKKGRKSSYERQVQTALQADPSLKDKIAEEIKQQLTATGKIDYKVVLAKLGLPAQQPAVTPTDNGAGPVTDANKQPQPQNPDRNYDPDEDTLRRWGMENTEAKPTLNEDEAFLKSIYGTGKKKAIWFN
jgi:hypothetical protein